MAKQVIGVGLVGNDGLGDPLRNAMVKVNENFTELYDDAFDGALITKYLRLTAMALLLFKMDLEQLMLMTI